jgi:hypothetical protein
MRQASAAGTDDSANTQQSSQSLRRPAFGLECRDQPDEDGETVSLRLRNHRAMMTGVLGG